MRLRDVGGQHIWIARHRLDAASLKHQHFEAAVMSA